MVRLTACLCAMMSSVVALADDPYQLIVCIAPAGSSSNPANWFAVDRFGFLGPVGASPSAFTPIPTTEVFDPIGVAFRSAQELYIGNRHGNVLGQGSVSRFTISPTGGSATFVSNFTQPGMIGVHEIAFSPATGELFCATVNSGVFRFTFDTNNNPVAGGSFINGQPVRGVIVHPGGQFVYTTHASGVIRTFQLGAGNSVTELTPTTVPGASNLHFFSRGPAGAGANDLYVADFGSGNVFRYLMLPGGGLTYKQTIPSEKAIDVAFSADAQEMFVATHQTGGLRRYTYNAGTDSWTYASTIATASLGCIGTYNQPPCGATDVGQQGGLPGADGVLDNNDFVAFIDYFFAQNPRADFGTQGGIVGGDGQFDNNDFVVFIDQFFFGCV